MLNTQIKQGTAIHTVPYTELAAAILSVGIPFLEGKKPLLKFVRGGKTILSWKLSDKSNDNTLRTEDLLKAWANYEKFIENNPDHPFSYAIAAIKTYINIKELAEKTPALVGFFGKDSDRVVWVAEGSANEKALREQGMNQV